METLKKGLWCLNIIHSPGTQPLPTTIVIPKNLTKLAWLLNNNLNWTSTTRISNQLNSSNKMAMLMVKKRSKRFFHPTQLMPQTNEMPIISQTKAQSARLSSPQKPWDQCKLRARMLMMKVMEKLITSPPPIYTLITSLTLAWDSRAAITSRVILTTTRSMTLKSLQILNSSSVLIQQCLTKMELTETILQAIHSKAKTLVPSLMMQLIFARKLHLKDTLPAARLALIPHLSKATTMDVTLCLAQQQSWLYH